MLGCLGLRPSPSGRGRRDSHAEREPDRAKPQELPGAPGEGHRFRQISRFEREFIHIFSGEE